MKSLADSHRWGVLEALRCSSSLDTSVATNVFVPYAVVPTRSARVIADEVPHCFALYSCADGKSDEMAVHCPWKGCRQVIPRAGQSNDALARYSESPAHPP